MSNAIDNYNKCEVVDGVVYDMSPAKGDHIRISGNNPSEAVNFLVSLKEKSF